MSRLVPYDEQGRQYKVEREELVLEEDPKGETKVDKDGNLKDNRQYRVRTFTLPDRGDQLFMLSTEASRCVGFRDSYLFFQRHQRLYKVVLTDQEKQDLISRDILPNSYRSRTISVVTARSVFREFGALIIVGGRRVADDYYEAEASRKYAAGELADPQDRLPPAGESYNTSQYVTWLDHGHHHNSGSNSSHHASPIPSSAHVPSWLYDHALAASRYNSFLCRSRAKLWDSSGVYEGNTGVSFYAADTQPSQARWSHKKGKSKGVVISTFISSRDRIAQTGLKNVDPSVYDCLDAETKSAIEEQIRYENNS